MPNHLHGLLWLEEDASISTVTLSQGPVLSGSLSAIIRSYKAATTRAARKIRQSLRLWQPNYYDCVIRDERELDTVRKYIETNPERWNQGCENLDELVDRMQKR